MQDLREIASTISSISNLPGFIESNDQIEMVRIGFLSQIALKNIYNLMFQQPSSDLGVHKGKKPTLMRIVNKYGLSFLCATHQTDMVMTIFFGPFFLESRDTQRIVNELITHKELGFTLETANTFASSIPVKDSSFIQSWAQVIARFLDMPISPYIKVNTINLSKSSQKEEVASISENRINEANISSHYRYEQELHKLIRHGDREKLRELLVPRDTSTASLASRHSVFEERVVGKNSLRAEKNLSITLNVMFRQAAFDSGLPALYVHSISEDIVNRIERANDREDLLAIIEKMIDNYCNSINNISYQNHSVNVVKVQKYIINNKSEKITLEDLCKITGLDESYLCRLFKRECHMTINEYIQTQRTNEAKWLLSSSDTPIIEISHMLGYSSQSYFCSVFRKIVGVTPSEYRMNRGKYYNLEETGSKGVQSDDH